jgi:hypothetical protein
MIHIQLNRKITVPRKYLDRHRVHQNVAGGPTLYIQNGSAHALTYQPTQTLVHPKVDGGPKLG